MFGLGGQEVIIILVIGALLFGASRIPELGRSLGSGIRNFKDGLTGFDEIKNEIEDNLKIDDKWNI